MQKIKPLTIEEVIEFKPSMENPMEVECFDEMYKRDWSTIKIVAVSNDKICVIGTDGDLSIIANKETLYHFASPKQPEEKIALYRTIDANGAAYYVNQNGQTADFFSQGFGGGDKWNIVRKANRQKEPCAFLDPETFEVEWV